MLAALYLPWQRASPDLSDFKGVPVGSVLNLFSGSESLDGWDTGVAPAGALAALLLVGLSAVAWARPGLIARLPLGRCALVAAYFAVAVAVETRSRVRLPFLTEEGDLSADIQLGYGAYIALAAAAAALLAALLLRRSELREHRSPLAVVRVILVAGLLVSFLLPWERLAGFDNPAISGPAAQVAAVFALCVPAVSLPLPRLGIAVLAALFAAAAFSTTTFPYTRAYGAWIAVGFALALVAVSLTREVRRPDLQGVPWSRLVLGTACLLLVAGFFLPWQEYCYPPGSLGPGPGGCVSANGWGSESGAGAAVLAIALVLALLANAQHLPPRFELAIGIALVVTTLSFQVDRGAGFSLRYGFWVGVVCTGLIVVLAAFGLGRPLLDTRLAPIAVCLAYLAVVVPTWWFSAFDLPRVLWYAPFSWITVTGALLALTLIRLWLARPLDTRQLSLVPVAIAGLATLDLVRAETITWGGGIVLGLCALLVLFAWVEHARGFGRLQVPEILRVDRL
jgi:hypothetical protein